MLDMKPNRHRMLLRTRLYELWPWRRKAHIGQCKIAADDYQGIMLMRLNAGLPVGPPATWNRPDPIWPNA